jgi:hypothetical protein
VALRVARADQTEVIARADELRELRRMTEAALGSDEGTLTFVRIATQSQDIVDAARLQLIEHRGDLGLACPDAGQVRHGLEPDFALDTLHQVDRQPARTAAGAVGHRDVCGLIGLQTSHGLEQSVDPRFVLWWKELEGKGGRRRRQFVGDFHGSNAL